jgi:hypothetical protein
MEINSRQGLKCCAYFTDNFKLLRPLLDQGVGQLGQLGVNNVG